MKNRILSLLVTLPWFCLASVACAQGTTFTYQGRLTDRANGASGSYDLVFTVWDSAFGTTSIGGAITNNRTTVSDGYFSVPLDFGESVFKGAERWIEISVRTNDGPAFVPLRPRQRIMPTPYAMFSGHAGVAETANLVSGENITGSVALTNAGNRFAGVFVGNGAGLTNLPPLPGKGIPMLHYVNFGALANKQPALDFKGQDGHGYVTTGPSTNQTAISNGAWSVHFDQGANYGSHIWTTNDTPTDFMWARLNYAKFSAGGPSGNPSAIFLVGNRPFDLGGGGFNPAWNNLFHIIVNNNAVTVEVWDDGYEHTLIGGFNFLPGWEVGGISRLFGFYFGDNTMTFFGDHIGFVSITNSLINIYRPTNGHPSYLSWEQYQGEAETNVTWKINFTEIGVGNYAALNQLLPGWIAELNPKMQVTAAGYETQYGVYDALTATNRPGSDAAGNLIKASTNASNGLFVKNSGRVGIGTPSPVSALQVVGTVTATAFNPPSDRDLKENFTGVNPREMLDKVVGLNITRWNFKGDITTPHIGPMAQDFHAAFRLGTDERHIATVDADGVALAAIQGLNHKLEEQLRSKDIEIEHLKNSVEVLRKLVLKSLGNAQP